MSQDVETRGIVTPSLYVPHRSVMLQAPNNQLWTQLAIISKIYEHTLDRAPDLLLPYCLFSGMRASWLLLRMRERRFEYHSQAMRMSSPSASYGVGISE